MQYWLFKSEPTTFSVDDLAASPKKTTFWDGVRNFRARNYLKDEIKKGDVVLFYHSNAKPPAVVGIAEVVKEGSPDPTQFDPESKYYDPAAKPEKPRWYGVEIRLQHKLPRAVGLDELRTTPGLDGMPLLKRGMRLSVQRVAKEHFDRVVGLANE